MPKYRVFVQETLEYEVEVEAGDDDEAGDLAVAMVINETLEQLAEAGVYPACIDRSIAQVEEL